MLLQSGQLPNKEECGTEAGADPAQNLSGAKSGTLKHFFDLETGGGGVVSSIWGCGNGS